VSVSFAAIQYLKRSVPYIADKKILIIGTGKIGGNTCRNIVDYLGNTNITLINRTPEKAVELASELNIAHASYNDLNKEVQAADVIIVSANAAQPILTKAHFSASDTKVLIDLSIPNNIDVSVKELPGIQLVNVDDLSRINDETLQKRLAEVPKAKAILAEHLEELKEWCANRRHVPFLKAAKQKLMNMHRCRLMLSCQPKETNKTLQPANPEAVKKIINNMAVKMRCINQPGCNYIQAINDYIDGSQS
ncbi:MAG: NAD(P)-binding domain-containing protein, partial [Bacteroidota bacterium]|nr:NAD(P)-binding domain-containing protein [Bacteroidota bacterium]